MIAEAIQHYSAQLGSIVFRTTMRALEVPGVYKARQVVYGKLDPTQPLDFSSAVALSNSMVRRYGKGFGSPITPDLTVLPAISVLPDADHALWGLGYEEATQMPGDRAMATLGIKSLSPKDFTAQDFSDLEACVDFQGLVVACLDQGVPVGTPRAAWPSNLTPVIPSTEPVVAPITVPVVSGPVATGPVASPPTAVPLSPNTPETLNSLSLQLASTKKSLALAGQVAASISDVIQGVVIPPKGGGTPINALRKISKILSER